MEDIECRVCGCTDYNCSSCIERTGKPCYWYEPDLCSACLGRYVEVHVTCSFKDGTGNAQKTSFDMDLTIGMDEDIQLTDAYKTALRQKGFLTYTDINVNYSIE